MDYAFEPAHDFTITNHGPLCVYLGGIGSTTENTNWNHWRHLTSLRAEIRCPGLVNGTGCLDALIKFLIEHINLHPQGINPNLHRDDLSDQSLQPRDIPTSRKWTESQ